MVPEREFGLREIQGWSESHLQAEFDRVLEQRAREATQSTDEVRYFNGLVREMKRRKALEAKGPKNAAGEKGSKREAPVASADAERESKDKPIQRVGRIELMKRYIAAHPPQEQLAEAKVRYPSTEELLAFARESGLQLESQASASAAKPNPRPRVFRPSDSEIQFSGETNGFVDWLVLQGNDQRALGELTPQALLLFFIAWCQQYEGTWLPFTSFVVESFPDYRQQAISAAFDALKRPTQRRGDFVFPMLTSACEEVLREAQLLVAALRRQEVEPYHLFAALLARAGKEKNPDTFLGLKAGRVNELGKAFMLHVKQGGYGEAWSLWAAVESNIAGIVGNFAYDWIRSAGTEAEIKIGLPESPTPPNSTSPAKAEAETTLAGADGLPPTGTRFRPRRNATHDELCLNIEAYAGAVADTFTGAAEENDFVFALYAPWGRGKSKLMEIVASILGGDSARKEPGRGYQCVTFSAWKYPTRPEIWVHLYQKLLREAHGESLAQKLRVSFRVGLLKHGWWPLILGFGLLAFSRLYWEMGELLFNGLGLLGLVILASFFWNASKLGKHVAHSYFSAPDHSEKLGLQAVIGQDLKDLLRVWTDPVGDAKADAKIGVCDFSRWRPARFCMATVVVLIWGALAVVAWKIHRHPPKALLANGGAVAMEAGTNRAVPFQVGIGVVTDKGAVVVQGTRSVRDGMVRSNVVGELPVAGGAADTNKALSPVVVGMDLVWNGAAIHLEGASLLGVKSLSEVEKDAGKAAYGWPRNLLFGLLSLTAVAVPLLAVWLAWSPQRPKRILLVVDDLDRCEPEQMLAVIESLRLFLDEPEMSRRLQIAMLLDRSILKQALLSRGKENDSIRPGTTEAAFFREQEEKFFVASLELPALTKTDISKLAERAIDNEYRSLLRLRKLAAEGRAEKPAPPGSKKIVTEVVPKLVIRPRIEEPVVVGKQTIRREETVPADAAAIAEWEKEIHDAKVEAAALAEELNQLEGRQNQPPASGPPKIEELTFSDAEREGLKKALSGLDPAGLTPRAVRAFIVRYQLVRLLLRHLKHAVVPTEVIPALAAQLFSKPDPALPELPSQVRAAIEAVAGKGTS